MEFRRLQKEDLELYFANRLRALQNAPSAFLTTYDEEKINGSDHFEKTLSRSDNSNVIFGAVLESKIVGTIGIYKEDRPKTSHKAGIWGMYVDVEHRQLGVGAKLLEIALAFAKDKMKVEVVGLSLESTNHQARKLYEAQGFKIWGVEPRAMKDADTSYDECHMVLIF